ncbi:hypothetical protein [Salinivibrio kushneri]|uniref:Uncharacterized protein n=1 Tax=Salinivibrio kushneri TaxID=1908198 RepID=A0AB36K930_9GAMM|nr:hypothetical protein [Salinivibrio kushneri]OOE45101.1 hypothetical protein BZG09_05190 [Salinivibrio kushneri]
MSQAENISNQHKALSLRVITGRPRNLAECDAIVDAAKANPKPAAESIAEARALFGRSHRASQLRMAFNSLAAAERAMVLAAGGLDHHLHTWNFEDFDTADRDKLRVGLARLERIVNRFATVLGPIKRLDKADFR